MSTPQSQRYHGGTIALHWLTAVAIVANIYVGLRFSDLPRGLERLSLFHLHASLGLLVLVLSVLTVAWRVSHPAPALPAGMPRWMTIAANASHHLLYLAMVGIPLSGWVMVSISATGPGLPYFGLFDWPWIPFLPSIPRASGHIYHELFETLHVMAAWGLILLLPVHILAALHHQYRMRDGVLARMVPWMKISS
jgi:cytochrome b561